MVVAMVPATAGHQRVLRLIAPAPAVAAFIAFALYWVWL
jgi:hypothetical protein